MFRRNKLATGTHFIDLVDERERIAGSFTQLLHVSTTAQNDYPTVTISNLEGHGFVLERREVSSTKVSYIEVPCRNPPEGVR